MKAPTLLLALLLASLLSVIKGEVHTTLNGKPHTLESTVEMGAVFTEGEEHCGQLYYLNITWGCHVANPPFSSQFNASFPSIAASQDLSGLVPFLFYVSARKIGCSSYAQVYEQLFPILETLPSSSRSKVFLTGSAINFFIGAAYEPYGELDYEALPYRFVSLPLLASIQVAKRQVSPQVCVTVGYGYLSTYFLGIGHYFTQVILGSIHVICIIMNLYEMYVSLRKRYWLRLIMFTSCALYPLLRLINFAWDDRNYFNQMGDRAYQTLLWGGFMSQYVANYSLLAMWLSVIKSDTIHSRIPPILFHIGYVIVPCVFIVAEISAILGAVSSSKASLLSVYGTSSVVMCAVSFLTAAFFILFGLIIIFRIRDNILVGKNALLLKITGAMLTTTLAILGVSIIGSLNSYHQNSLIPIPGKRLLAMIVCWEVIPTIMVLGPTFSFSSLPKLGNPLSSKSEQTTVTSNSRNSYPSKVHEEKDLAMAMSTVSPPA